MSADRQTGMGIGRIPFTSIDRYADRYGIRDIDDFDRFRFIIRAMDSEFLAVSNMKPGEISAQDADGVKGLLKRAAEGKQG